MTSADYTSFRALAFDIYGTLIDWESSIITQFAHHIGGDDSKKVSRDQVINVFKKHEHELQTTSPTRPYRDIANEAAHLTNDELTAITGAKTGLSAEKVNIAGWKAFPDTVSAMQRLKRHYKLIALSNIDHQSFHSTLSGPLRDVNFDATYIAEDIGSYKPDLRNFEYLIDHVKEDFGIEKEQILMVAHGLETDHAVLTKVGMEGGVWIMRGDSEKLKSEAEKLGFGARLETLVDFADAVEEAFEDREKKEEKERKDEDVGEALVELEDKGIGGS